jgi:hypothetical protein
VLREHRGDEGGDEAHALPTLASARFAARAAIRPAASPASAPVATPCSGRATIEAMTSTTGSPRSKRAESSALPMMPHPEDAPMPTTPEWPSGVARRLCRHGLARPLRRRLLPH